MFQKASVIRLPLPGFDQPKAAPRQVSRRRAEPSGPAPVPAEADFTPDVIASGFENFGRAGLQLGGLDRDRQWVGAWGGRC